MHELIICDLGGVLFDIDFKLTVDAFQNLRGYHGKRIAFGVDDQADVFIRYDKGQISTTEFIAELRTLYGFTGADGDIANAWCALLKSPFTFATRTVAALSGKAKQIVLLSNISELHLQQESKSCGEIFALFDALYFSCRINLRKPDPKAYLYVCELHGVTPENTLLVDDSPANCLSAATIGMKTYRVSDPSKTEFSIL
ncbi:MAG: HAD family phosphatase [Ignavibacteria bacterium]|nr:HAD family phosphatase [Ignavibacteria bacterium]